MSVAKGFVTQTAFKKHLDGDWRTVHELWSHIRNYMTSYAQPGGFTQGSVAFVGSDGFLTEDNSNFFYDNANNRLGVGIGAPVCTGHFRGAACADYAGIHPDTILLIENDDHAYIQLQAATNANAGIVFVDDDFNPPAGLVRYDFANEQIEFGVGTNEILRLQAGPTFDYAGTLTFSGTITIANGGSINLQEDITFTGATAQNLIKFPDNLPTALDFREAATSYLKFVSSNDAEKVVFGKIFQGITGSTIGNLTLANGSITDSGGSISFGNENLSTTGTTTLYGDIYTDRWLNRDENTFIGIGVCGDGNLAHVAGSEGWHNAAIGYNCLKAITDGERNVALGSIALEKCTTGENNVGIGFNALNANVVGVYNVGIGSDAGRIITASYNLAIGKGALYTLASGSGNVGIGTSALYSTSWGSYSIAIGHQSANNVANPAGSVYIGYQAGYGVAAKENDYSVFIGYKAGFSIDVGNDNVCIGAEAGYNITTGAANVCIGHDAGKGQLTTDSNELWIANSNTANPLIYGEFPNTLLRINAPLDIGRDGALRGALTLWDGGGGNTPGYMKIHSPDGTAWYVFVEDDGTVKIHNAAPAANADGDAIGDQTD